jgi:hypothetical protein
VKQKVALKLCTSGPQGVERGPTLDALKAADPNIFMKVPELEDIVIRERQFSETFATVADARHAAAQAADLETLRAGLAKGDPSVVLDALATQSPEALSLFVENFLPAVDRVSSDLFARGVLPLLDFLLQVARNEGALTGDETLTRAADRLARHFCRPEEQLEADEAFNDFTRDVKVELYARLEGMITDGVDDRSGSLNGFTRRAIVKEAIEELSQRFVGDGQLASLTSSLRDLARAGGLNTMYKEALIEAHLSCARPLVPGILDRLVAEAAGEMTRPRANPGSTGDRATAVVVSNRRVH